MAYYLRLYCVTLVAFLAVDIIWLGLVARTFYRQYLGFLLAPGTHWAAAISVYLLLILGILVFAVLPGLRDNSLKTALARAALFGFIAYGTYDLTNLATVRDWPLVVTIVDMAWGTMLSTMVSCVGFLAGRWIH